MDKTDIKKIPSAGSGRQTAELPKPVQQTVASITPPTQHIIFKPGPLQFSESEIHHDHIPEAFRDDFSKNLLTNNTLHLPDGSEYKLKNSISGGFIQSNGSHPKEPTKSSKLFIKGQVTHDELQHAMKKEDPLGLFVSGDLPTLTNQPLTTAHREALYPQMASEVFGLGKYVPKTAVFFHPHHNKFYSAQHFIEGRHLPASDYSKLTSEHPHFKTDFQKMAIMNMLMGNRDRHTGNIMHSEHEGLPYPKIHLIDNSFALDYHNVLHKKIPSYAMHMVNDDINPEVHEWLQDIDTNKAVNKLRSFGASEGAIDTFKRRLDNAKAWSTNSTTLGSGGSKLGSVMHIGHATTYPTSSPALDRNGTVKAMGEVGNPRILFDENGNIIKR